MQTRGKRPRDGADRDDERKSALGNSKRQRLGVLIKPFVFQLHPGQPRATLLSRLNDLALAQVIQHNACACLKHLLTDSLLRVRLQLRIIGNAIDIHGPSHQILAFRIADTVTRERFGQDRCFQHPPVAAAPGDVGMVQGAPASVEPKCLLSGLSKALVVCISQFMELYEVAALGNTNRTNRQLASLRVHGDAQLSPCLERRQHFDFYNYSWQEGERAACVGADDIRALVQRTTQVQSLALDLADTCVLGLAADLAVASRSTLTDVSLTYHFAFGCSQQQLRKHPLPMSSLRALLSCPRLRKLTLVNNQGHFDKIPMPMLGVSSHSLEILCCEPWLCDALTQAAPNLRRLQCHHSFWRTADVFQRLARACPKLEYLDGEIPIGALACLRPFPCLRAVYIFGVNHLVDGSHDTSVVGSDWGSDTVETVNVWWVGLARGAVELLKKFFPRLERIVHAGSKELYWSSGGRDL